MVALRKLVYMHPSREHEQFHLLRLRESVVWFNQHHVVSEEPRTIFRHTREISQVCFFTNMLWSTDLNTTHPVPDSTPSASTSSTSIYYITKALKPLPTTGNTCSCPLWISNACGCSLLCSTGTFTFLLGWFWLPYGYSRKSKNMSEGEGLGWMQGWIPHITSRDALLFNLICRFPRGPKKQDLYLNFPLLHPDLLSLSWVHQSLLSA